VGESAAAFGRLLARARMGRPQRRWAAIASSPCPTYRLRVPSKLSTTQKTRDGHGLPLTIGRARRSSGLLIATNSWKCACALVGGSLPRNRRMHKNHGARCQISGDGKPRSHRSDRAIAVDGNHPDDRSKRPIQPSSVLLLRSAVDSSSPRFAVTCGAPLCAWQPPR